MFMIDMELYSQKGLQASKQNSLREPTLSQLKISIHGPSGWKFVELRVSSCLIEIGVKHLQIINYSSYLNLDDCNMRFFFLHMLHLLNIYEHLPKKSYPNVFMSVVRSLSPRCEPWCWEYGSLHLLSELPIFL